MIHTRPVLPEQTHTLRLRILRPHQSLAEMVYPGDDDTETSHFGAFDAEALVGVVSLYREGLPEDERPTDWRFRGMAVDTSRQRAGIGRHLMETMIAHARAQGGRRLWCNARTAAQGFYERNGMRPHGEIFDLVAIGPHVVMVMDL